MSEDTKSLKLEEHIKERISTIDSEVKELSENIKKSANRLEKLRNSKVILFLQGEDTISRLQVNDIYNRYKGLLKNRIAKLDIIVHSSGGDIDAAYHLVMLFRKMAGKELNFIVPRWAKSAATCLVVGGDNLLMGETSEVGPVDPQLTIGNPEDKNEETFSPLSIDITLAVLGNLLKDGHEKLVDKLIGRISPFSIGEYKRLLTISPTYLSKILSTRMLRDGNKDKIKDISNILGQGYPHHGYCVLLDDIREMGLNVHTMNDKQWSIVWDIWCSHNKIQSLLHEKRHIENDLLLDIIRKLDNKNINIEELVKKNLKRLYL